MSNKTKLTNRDVKVLTAGLQALDAFDFESKTIYTIAYNLQKLESADKAMEKARVRLRKQYPEGMVTPKQDPVTKQVTPGDKDFDKFVQEYEILLDQEVDVELRQINYADLRAGDGSEIEVDGKKKKTNKIPPSVLGLLLGVVVRDDAQPNPV